MNFSDTYTLFKDYQNSQTLYTFDLKRPISLFPNTLVSVWKKSIS